MGKCIFCETEDAYHHKGVTLCEQCLDREMPSLIAAVLGPYPVPVVMARVKVMEAEIKEILKREIYRKLRHRWSYQQEQKQWNRERGIG